MSPEGTVRVDQVWKRFRVDRGRRLLRDHLGRGKALFTRKPADEDPWRWVLRDISFELEPGESVGIVGANGAGKSTLFKIIAGVMFPHTGRVETMGSVGALIEVMSGIHSELTGRENITIYANLLGLSRKQVEDKFDEIVAFAEIENAVDRQVKFYSSGMKVRLGFAIAAFLEPTILIVDEVLAVGDATFQQKCLDRIRHVIQNGTTLLLVSHDLATVGATTKRGIWLSDGIMRADGPVDEVLGAYRQDIEGYAAEHANVQGAVRIHDIRTEGPDGRMVEVNEILHGPVRHRGGRRALRPALPRGQPGSVHSDLRRRTRRAREEGRRGVRGHDPAPPAARRELLLVVRQLREPDVQGAHGVAARGPVPRLGRAAPPAAAACNRAPLTRLRDGHMVEGVVNPAGSSPSTRPLVSVIIPAHNRPSTSGRR